MGAEDDNNNSIGGDSATCAATLTCAFNAGDAIEVGHTDSFDDNVPTDCPADSSNFDVGNPDAFHLPPAPDAATQFNGRCFDGIRNFNQVRPAVFDGGYGLGAPFSGRRLPGARFLRRRGQYTSRLPAA